MYEADTGPTATHPVVDHHSLDDLARMLSELPRGDDDDEPSAATAAIGGLPPWLGPAAQAQAEEEEEEEDEEDPPRPPRSRYVDDEAGEE